MKDILSILEDWPFADALAVRLQVLIQPIHVDDHADATKCAMSQLIGRDSEVSILSTDESTKNVHEEAVAPPEFVRLACEKIPVDFGVARDPAYRLVLKCEPCLGILWLILVFGRLDLIGGRLRQFIDVLTENPLFQAPFAGLAGFQLRTVQIDREVVTQGQRGAQHPLQLGPADFVDLFFEVREDCESP